MSELHFDRFPLYLQIDIREMQRAIEEQHQFTDCEEDSLASSIKSALVNGEITEYDAKAILERWKVL